MPALLHILALLAYLSAGGTLVMAFARRTGASALPTWIAAAGVFVHAVALWVYVSTWGELPLAGLGPVLSTIAFLVALGSVLVTVMWRVGPIGLLLTPIAAVLQAIALAVGIFPTPTTPSPAGFGFVVHVLLAVIAYGGLAVAFAAGLMYLLQFRQLKGKRFGAVFRFFPPLETLDRVGRAATLVAFLSISGALAVGWGWTATAAGSLDMGNPQVIWGVLTWLVLLGILLARRGGGRRERRAATVTVVGFILVVVAFVALRAGVTRGEGFL